MARSKSKANITDGELDVLRILWAKPRSTIQNVFDALSGAGKMSRSTVNNRMTSMEVKGLIRSVDERRPKQYEAAVEMEAAANTMLDDVRKRVFGGSISRMALHLLSTFKATRADRQAVQDELDKMR